MRILSDGYVHILNRADRLIRHISIVGVADAVHEESDLRDIGRAVVDLGRAVVVTGVDFAAQLTAAADLVDAHDPLGAAAEQPPANDDAVGRGCLDPGGTRTRRGSQDTFVAGDDHVIVRRGAQSTAGVSGAPLGRAHELAVATIIARIERCGPGTVIKRPPADKAWVSAASNALRYHAQHQNYGDQVSEFSQHVCPPTKNLPKYPYP